MKELFHFLPLQKTTSLLLPGTLLSSILTYHLIVLFNEDIITLSPYNK